MKKMSCKCQTLCNDVFHSKLFAKLINAVLVCKKGPVKGLSFIQLQTCKWFSGSIFHLV